jgi:hypothetical protein
MDAQMIVATARSGEAPGTWMVWPLRRDFIRNSILRWLAVTVVGFLLFIPAIISTVPGVFSLRGFSFVLTGIILLALGALAFGALGITLYDTWRLLHANDYWLVITPDEYIRSTSRGKIIHVPLESIDSITLKGVRVSLDSAETPFDGTGAGVNPLLRVPTRLSNYRKRRATPSSLAFLDTRTGQEVIVATDAAFDELVGIEYVLSMQVDLKQRQLNRSRSSSG